MGRRTYQTETNIKENYFYDLNFFLYKIKKFLRWVLFPSFTSVEVVEHFKNRNILFCLREILIFSTLGTFKEAVTDPRAFNYIFRLLLNILWQYYNVRAFVKISVGIWTFLLFNPFFTPFALLIFSCGTFATKVVCRMALNMWHKDLNVRFLPTFRDYGIRFFVGLVMFFLFQVVLWLENEILCMEEVSSSDEKLDVCKEKIEILQKSKEFRGLGSHHITNACFQLRKEADLQVQLEERVYSNNSIAQMCWAKWESISYMSKTEVKFDNVNFKPKPFFQSSYEKTCEEMVKIDQRNSLKLYEESLEKK